MISDNFGNQHVEEKNVYEWLNVIEDPPSKELYHDLIFEELNEFVHAVKDNGNSFKSETDRQIHITKELLDLLWVCIGYYIACGKANNLLNTETPVLQYVENNGYLHTSNVVISTNKFVTNNCSHPDYVYLKSLIINYVTNSCYLSYTKAWKALVKSNFSKFISTNAENSIDIVQESLKNVDTERYTPYLVTQDDYYLIKDRTSKKLLKPTTFEEFVY